MGERTKSAHLQTDETHVFSRSATHGTSSAQNFKHTMVIGDAPSQTCGYCSDELCEWAQYGKDIKGSRLRMLMCRHSRRTSRQVMPAAPLRRIN
ncbi:uncharacterized protein PITG_09264 [Phytophthora infestans T30-4]|uniref:Uncharacterized protein n=1 Tax=Phytophthora infestans (strain T30-4) TaxID=403677 RepID=D0NBA0_PHYIT|nr:uncharacterized protein PITG_09264 [Phytophthora infestans T30-4]EEY55329.1 hypothetical protein PITG_09264 [Phytophthora infestans T30-4]|eukprot:XP_002903553.1 hypothetical protein PITG_09264 [Phytophthora infestans T30-4]